MKNYANLFEPFYIGGTEIKNRIVMAPMGSCGCNLDGTISSTVIDYYEERAKGGTGLIIMGVQFLKMEMTKDSREGVLENVNVIPELATLCRAVHRYDSKIIAQISVGTGRNGALNESGEPLVSSSALPAFLDPDHICRPLTKEELADYVQRFRTAASIAKRAGFDGIEIHGHVGYLLDQFISSCWNKREDEYGGSVENRVRFPAELIHAVKEVNGADYPVIFRMALCHMFEGGRPISEGQQIIAELEKCGVDAFDLDVGSYENQDYVFPPTYLGDACFSFIAQPARESVSVPLLIAGNHTPETALKMVESDGLTIPMFGRSLIAEPAIANKLMQERREDIRPCIRCNEGCIGRAFTTGEKVGCVINVSASDEVRFSIKPAQNRKNIVVIGGGPAGLEAARAASLCGHNVTLFEKEGYIGGQLAAAATPSFKKRLKEFIRWYDMQLHKQGVKVILGTEIDAYTPALSQCDYILVAVGAKPIVPQIPGINGANVIGVIEAHQNKALITGDDIVVCGGGLSGCDCALELAMDLNKKNVTIVEMLPEVAKDMFLLNKISLMTKLNEYGVNIKTNTKVIAFESDGIIIESEGNQQKLPASTIVTAFGMTAQKEVAQKIQSKYRYKTRVIGDCSHVAKVGDAVTAGYFAGISIPE